MIPIANESVELELVFPSGGEGGTVQILAIPDPRFRVDGGDCYFGPIQCAVTGITNSSQGADGPSATVVVVINPTATSVLLAGNYPIREGDSASGVAYPLKPDTTSAPTAFTLRIKAAGQTTVRCD